VNPPRRLVAALALSVAAAARAEQPLTLDDALAIAARQNPSLALARADAAIAQSDRMTSLGNVLPRLDLTSSAGRTFLGASTLSSVNPITQQVLAPSGAQDFPSYSLALQLTQPVFDWRSFRDVSRAGSSAQAAELQFDEARLTIAFDVTRAFYEVIRAERTLAVFEKTVSRSEDLVARADALYSAGRGTRADTYSARANLASDRISAEQQRALVTAARTALAQVLGQTGGADLTVVPPASLDAPGVPSAELPEADALLAAARSRRPALRAQRALVDAADAAVSSAQGGYFPTVGAQGSYSRSGTDLGGQGGVFGNPTKQYVAALQFVLSWNLFEGRKTLAEVQRAEASARRAGASEAQTIEAVSKEIIDARTLAASRARQVALAVDNQKVAEQALSLARQRLDAGLTTQLEVRDASLKLTQAELSLLQARIDHAIALADLARAAGGSL
jgi:outer membrane protein TolC